MFNNIKSTIKKLNRNLWTLAFTDLPEQIVKSTHRPTFHYLKHSYKDRWFADPFILEVTSDEIIVLVEELEYERNIGRIARLIIDKGSYQLKDMKIILELPTHLSFPFIYRRDDKIYVLPENSASGCSTIYEYKNDTLVPLKVVCNEPLTDATIAEINGKNYMLSTQVPEQNGSVLQIRTFDPETLTTGEIVDTITFDLNIARNAGEVFCVEGKYYRPAQDCNNSYGAGTIFQELHFYEGQFDFNNIGSLYPDNFKYYRGLHTFNTYKGYAVIDVLGKRNPIVARILSLILRK